MEKFLFCLRILLLLPSNSVAFGLLATREQYLKLIKLLVELPYINGKNRKVIENLVR